MISETHDNFYVIKNAITDAQIDILINWFESRTYLTKKNGQIDIRPDNNWDPYSAYKQKISIPVRKTTIIGMPHNTFNFVKDLLENIFYTISDKPLEIESPSYFQKYEVGGHHDIHHDIEPGYLNRKYILGFQLSDSDSYTGGNLYIKNSEGVFSNPCPRDKGCAIIYEPGLMHYVSTITKGTRYAFNECAGKNTVKGAL